LILSLYLTLLTLFHIKNISVRKTIDFKAMNLLKKHQIDYKKRHSYLLDGNNNDKIPKIEGDDFIKESSLNLLDSGESSIDNSYDKDNNFDKLGGKSLDNSLDNSPLNLALPDSLDSFNQMNSNKMPDFSDLEKNFLFNKYTQKEFKKENYSSGNMLKTNSRRSRRLETKLKHSKENSLENSLESSIENRLENIKPNSKSNSLDSSKLNRVDNIHSKQSSSMQNYSIPKSILNTPIREKYNYDSLQLIEVLKAIELKTKNLYKIVDILTVIRKKRQLRIYDFPEISKYLQYLQENMSELNNSYLVTFFYSLSKFNFDPESNQKLIYDILKELSTEDRMCSYKIRESSNLLLALQNFYLKSPKNFNFDEFFMNYELNIISCLTSHQNRIDPQSISNIVLAYCKTQNGSSDFYYALQNYIIEMKDEFSYQELANIIYSYANNKTCNERLLEEFHDDILFKIKKFKPMELCSILRGYHKRNLVSDIMKKEFQVVFTDKYMLMTPLDIAYFYSILVEGGEDFKKDNKKFLTIIHASIEKLKNSFTSAELAILFEKGVELQEHNPSLMEQLKHQVEILIHNRNTKGYELLKIHDISKKLKFKGEYNLFREKIEQYLMKIKYYY